MSRLRSSCGGVDDGLGKGLRRFLRQVMPHAAGDRPVLVFAGEHLGVGRGFRMRRAIGIALESDGRHCDRRKFGQPLFQMIIFRLTFGKAEPSAIVMDDDIDMIWVVERSRASVESGVVEVPFRRGKMPD